MYSDLWINEKYENFYSTGFKVKEVLFSGKSDFQTVDIVDTEYFGKVLLNDGLVMLTEKDEFIYHEMITHVPLFTHPKPEKVLVIGGGDGGTAREVLRHSSVKKCVMVEIDELVVEACRKFIPQTSSELNNEKLELRIEDGLSYVKETNEKFDVVIVDSTDPIGPAKPLFGEAFYSDIFNVLTSEGIVVSQGESPFFNEDMQKNLLSILGQFFPISLLYNFTNLSYPGGYWSFTFASKKFHPLKSFETERVVKSDLKFKYYNDSIHCASFVQPQFVKDSYKNLLKE